MSDTATIRATLLKESEKAVYLAIVAREVCCDVEVHHASTGSIYVTASRYSHTSTRQTNGMYRTRYDLIFKVRFANHSEVYCTTDYSVAPGDHSMKVVRAALLRELRATERTVRRLRRLRLMRKANA